MSSEAFVFCRLRPDLPERGEFSGGRFPFEVRRTDGTDAEAFRRGGVDPGSLPWVVALEVSGEWYDAFVQGGTVIAQRCGGGLLWFAAWPRPEPVEAMPATPGRSLFSAAQRGFDEAVDEDLDPGEGPPPQGGEPPSPRALSHVLGLARARALRPDAVHPQTRLSELGLVGSWGQLLIGTDFDEFNLLNDPSWNPQTLEDVARLFDARWAHDRAQPKQPVARSPPERIDIGRSLAALEAERGATKQVAAAPPGSPRVSGAEHPGDRRSPTAFWWAAPSREVSVVFQAVGGGPAGERLAALAKDALTVPRGSTLRDRTVWALKRLDEALRPRLGPAFVACGSIASAGLSRGRAVVAHVGSVRVYRVTGRGLERVTADHTVEMPGGGRVTTRYLGAEVPLDFDVVELELPAGEALLVCTEAVCSHLDDAALASLVRRGGVDAPGQIIAQLRQLAPDDPAAVALAS